MEVSVTIRVNAINQIVVEGDASQVVLELRQGKDNWSQGGCLIQDAGILLNSFANWSTHHVYREANMVAHKLAKHILSLDNDVYELESIPLCIWQDGYFPIMSMKDEV